MDERMAIVAGPEFIARALNGSPCPQKDCGGTLSFSYKADSRSKIIVPSIKLTCNFCRQHVPLNGVKLYVEKDSQTS